MLGKLLKYDIKTELKSLLPMYLITLGLAIIVRLIDNLKKTFPIITSIHGFMMVLCVIAIVGVIIWTLIVAIKHFYNNILKDEGYLTNTLPVSRNQIILSKEITAFMMMVLAVVVMATATFVAFYHGGIQAFFESIGQAMDVQGVDPNAMIIWLIIMMAISYISQVMLCYTAMMLGQTRNTNKVMYSIVFGIVIYCILQVVSLISLAFDFLISPELMDIMSQSNPSFHDVYDYIVLIFATSIVITLITMVAFHAISVYLANKKLNLE